MRRCRRLSVGDLTVIGVRVGCHGVPRNRYPKMSLTHSAVLGAKPQQKPYKLYDERGLFLLVKPNGACLRTSSWRTTSTPAPSDRPRNQPRQTPWRPSPRSGCRPSGRRDDSCRLESDYYPAWRSASRISAAPWTTGGQSRCCCARERFGRAHRGDVRVIAAALHTRNSLHRSCRRFPCISLAADMSRVVASASLWRQAAMGRSQ
jgi:hypothetical protein